MTWNVFLLKALFISIKYGETSQKTEPTDTADEHLTCTKLQFTRFLLTLSAELLSLNGCIHVSLSLAGITCGQMHFIFKFQN